MQFWACFTLKVGLKIRSHLYQKIQYLYSHHRDVMTMWTHVTNMEYQLWSCDRMFRILCLCNDCRCSGNCDMKTETKLQVVQTGCAKQLQCIHRMCTFHISWCTGGDLACFMHIYSQHEAGLVLSMRWPHICPQSSHFPTQPPARTHSRSKLLD